MKTQEIRSRLFYTLLLGFAAGFVLGAMIVLVMQEVLGLQPTVNASLFASAGWCGILFYFIKLFCLLLPGAAAESFRRGFFSEAWFFRS